MAQLRNRFSKRQRNIVSEGLLVYFGVNVENTLLEMPLHVGNRLVVYDRPDLRDDELKQCLSAEVAQGFVQVLVKVTLQRGHGGLTRVVRNNDTHVVWSRMVRRLGDAVQ